VVDVTDDVIYLMVSVRNAGAGLAVLNAWHISARGDHIPTGEPDLEGFRRLTRDLYVAPGDTGFWQGALREPADPLFTEIATAARERRPMDLEVSYGDVDGGQRAVTRFGLMPRPDGQWLPAVSRHFTLDRAGPRSQG